MSYDRKVTATVVKKLREEKRISQTKLAMDLCVSREVIVRLENATRDASLDLIVQLAEYFSVSIDYLIQGVQRVPSTSINLDDIIVKLQVLKHDLML